MQTFPKFGDKTGLQPAFTPKDAISITDNAKLSGMPKRAIIIFSDDLEKKIKKELALSKYDLPFSSHFHKYHNMTPYIDKENKVLVIKSGIGSPVIAIVAEDLISVGVKEIVILGTAGGMGKDLSLGDIIICTKALRDEGTSHHYIKDSVFVDSDQGLANAIETQIQASKMKFRKGATWSVDALYAETKDELDKYSGMNVLTVEMEAAALFAVAQRRGARAGAVFMVSDLVNGQSWTGLREHELKIGFSNLAKVGGLYLRINQT